MQLFYEPEILTNGGLLNMEESHHCIKVLRYRKGDAITIIDGKGSSISARITDDSPKACKVSVIKTNYLPPPPVSCHIAVAPTKNIDRFEWFIEKSCEIGIEKITPLLCEKSERKILKLERLEKIITTASKQSGNLWRPQLFPLTNYKDFILKTSEGDKFIAHCHEGDKESFFKMCKQGKNTNILIGPEGDFSKNEIKLAEENGFRSISLGETRLRTETAAFVAAHIFRLVNYS